MVKSGDGVRCLFCKKIIENPRQYGDKIIQKFCSDKCRYNYHNEIKREERLLIKETISLLKKISQNRGESNIG
jgi:predicted nucleic acid-binding Zn ribbon protein